MPKFMIMRRKLVNGKEHKKEMLIQNAIVGFQFEVQIILMTNLKKQAENILMLIKEMVFGFR
jgi:hypothetical protein